MSTFKALRTIVVVEGDPASRVGAIESFQSAGLQVVEFDEGEPALSYLRSHNDDVEAVFVDLERLGTSEGVDLANVIAQVCPTIAVIATGEPDTDRPDAMDPQVRYFAKPWKALDVVVAMQDIVMGQ